MRDLNLLVPKTQEAKVDAPRAYSLEHLGTFETKSGVKLETSVYERDPYDDNGREKGWVCHRIFAEIAGEEVGFIKMAYIPRSAFESLYPDLLHFAQSYMGRLPGIDINDKDQIWNSLNRNFGTVGRTIPVSREKVDEQIEFWLEEHISQEFTRVQSNLIDRPMVAMIRTNLERQHVAISLYEVAARWLAERGYALHSDGPTGHAPSVWEKMRADPRYPITKSQRANGSPQYVLDYR